MKCFYPGILAKVKVILLPYEGKAIYLSCNCYSIVWFWFHISIWFLSVTLERGLNDIGDHTLDNGKCITSAQFDN